MLSKEFLEKLRNAINDKRRIRENSMKLYIQNLNKLSKMINGDKEVDNLDFLEDKEKVDEVLEDKKLTTRKTYYASILVGLSAMDYDNKELATKYRDEMEEMADTNNKQIKEQRATETQQENWVSLEKLRKVMKDYRNELNMKGIFKKDKENITRRDRDLLQKWIAVSLYLMDDENPPIRLEYGDMKIIANSLYNKMSPEDKEKGNYLVVKSRNNKAFSLGDYKTSGKYGVKVIPVGKKLNSALNIWLKFNDSGHLLLNSKDESLTRNGLTKLLNKAFEPTGKRNIGASMLRHIYITERFPPDNAEREEVASKMGHSVSQQTDYAKKVEEE